jgi:hypothetical protein
MTDESQQNFVATFEKNSREEVRVSVDLYQGRQIINIRVYYRDKENGAQWLPGKQGLALSVDRYRDLAEAVLKLGEKLEADGLLPGSRSP